MTRAEKERRRNQLNNSAQATSDHVEPGGFSSPSRKRKVSFGDGTNSSEKKVGKRRQSNQVDTDTSAATSKDSKGKEKAEIQQYNTTSTSNSTDQMGIDDTANTSKVVEETHGEKNTETTACGTTLKAPRASIGCSHSDGKMAVMDCNRDDDQRETKTEYADSSDSIDGSINNSDEHEDDGTDDDPEDLDDGDHDSMLLDSGIGGGFASRSNDDYDDENDGNGDDYDDDDGYYRYQYGGKTGVHQPFGNARNRISGQQFKTILENLKSNDDQEQQRNTLQVLAETLSISSEESLAGHFPCDDFAQELIKIMKGSARPDENQDKDITQDFTLKDQSGGGNPELMILACRCVSNLLDVFPSSAQHMVNHGVIDVLCDKLRSIQYIDLAEQALEALKEFAGQTPVAVIESGGLGAAFLHFNFFSNYSQRTALQMASQCLRFINTGYYLQLVAILPTLTNTLASADRTVVELTCLCWARLSENYKSSLTEFEKALSVDILNAMVNLLPVPRNANAIRSSAFNDILRVFQSVAKASPTLGYQLLDLDVTRGFYQVLTGATDLPSSPTPSISLDNTWHDSLHTMLNIIVDLLPPLPNELNWDRFKITEPIALRTRSRTAHQKDSPTTSSIVASSSPRAVVKSPSISDPRAELLRNNPQVLQRVGVILFPLLLEIFSSTVNMGIRQLATHTMVKLVFFMDGDILKHSLQDIPLSAFLADLLVHQEHPVFVIDALFQAEFLLKKLPGIYSTLLRREGVYHAAKALADQPMDENDDAANLEGKTSEETNRDLGHNSLLTTICTNTKSERYDTMQRPSTYSHGDFPSTPNLTIPTNNATNELLHRPVIPPDINQNLDNLWDQHLFLLKDLQNQQHLIRGSKSGIGQDSIRQFIIRLAKKHIEDYARTSRWVKKNDMVSLQVLKSFGDGLLGSPDDTTARKVLEKFVQHINSTIIGISGFELLDSGILEALIGYLTIQKEENCEYAATLVQRRQAFYAVFLETLEMDQGTGILVSPALRILVQRLETLLTRFERFEVELPLGSTMTSSPPSISLVQNPVPLVTRQIHLRLFGLGPYIPPDFQQLTVDTLAVSTFRPLETYLMTHMIGTHAILCKSETQNLQNNGNKSTPSSNTETMDIDKTELDAEGSSHHTSLQNDTTETTSLPTSTVTGSSAGPLASASSPSSSTPTANTTTEKSQKTINGKLELQFYIDNTLVHKDTSLYGAIHRLEMKKRKENRSRAANCNIWTTAYPVKFELIPIDGKQKKPAPISSLPEQLTDDNNNNMCAKILRLLKELASISETSSPVSPHFSQIDNTATALVPRTDFVNRKLTTKIQRQLEEPLMVACACLPDWVYYCMDNYPFLFPFDVRYLYLRSTSFGVSRLLANWKSIHSQDNSNIQNGQQLQQHIGTGRHGGGMGGANDLLEPSTTITRINRKRVQVRRDRILNYVINIMALPDNTQSVLEIDYVNEEGIGLGPTLEFYALASKEFCKTSTRMWRQENTNNSVDDDDRDDINNTKLYATSQHGLFPAPFFQQMHQKQRKEIVQLFKTLGQFVAKSILDSRMIDIPFSVAFFKRLFCDDGDPLALIMDIDPALGRSISYLQAFVDKKRLIENDIALTPEKRDKLIGNIEIDGATIEDLHLDFTLPGSVDIKLKRQGSEFPVTIESVDEYLQLLGDMVAVSGINEQLSAFCDGFNELFSVKRLKVLTCQELVSLFSSSIEDWSYSTLADAIKADHGFTMDSVVIKDLLEILSEMTVNEQRDFLQFTTGSPRLPIGGWKSMRPMFTVVKKHYEAPLGPDDYLPSVMTCANYLKMPNYTNKKIMHKQLLKSMHEGKNSFLLS